MLAPYSRVHFFQDIVGLTTIAVLMKEHKISVQKLRKVAEELIRRGYDYWVDVKLWVAKGQVHSRPPRSGSSFRACPIHREWVVVFESLTRHDSDALFRFVPKMRQS
ncbi:hypothetical protein ACVWZK_004160 [Bradyrhizobium sp. GM0.4]